MVQTAQPPEERPHPVIPAARWAALHRSVRWHPITPGVPIVYLVTNDLARTGGQIPQVVKIGTTVDLPLRMDRMHRRRPGFRARLVHWLDGGERQERHLHRLYSAQRVGASGDWFWTAGDLGEALLALLDGSDPWQ